MLQKVFTTRLHGPVIDLDLDPKLRTIAVVTAGGFAYVTDYYGNVILEKKLNFPAWGVSHCYDDDDRLFLAVGCASKSPAAGAILLFRDDELVLEYDVEQAVWDVELSERGQKLVATSWNSSLFVIDVTQAIRSKDILYTEIKFEASLYGLSYLSSNQLTIAVDRVGHFLFDTTTHERRPLAKSPSCCYNIATSSELNLTVSGTHGPYLHAYSLDGKELWKVEAKDVAAVCFAGDSLLFGTLQGDLGLRTALDPSFDVIRASFSGDIWHLAYDELNQLIFFALGNAGLACYELPKAILRNPAFEAFLKDKKPTVKTLCQALEAGLPPASLLSKLEHSRVLDRASADDLRQLAEILTSKRRGQTSPWADALLLYAYHLLEQPEKALALAFEYTKHDPGYQARLPTSMNSALMIYIHQLQDQQEHQLLAPPNSLLAASVREHRRLQSLKDIDRGPTGERVSHPLGDTRVLADGLLTSLRQDPLAYGMVNYIKYHHASPADTAKKVLELAVVRSSVPHPIEIRPSIPDADRPRSLDIGCATCRYPLLFAEWGYSATGYDIDDAAISIGRKASADNPNLTIKKRNVLDEDPEFQRYNVITCMMGTFNHMRLDSHPTLCSWAFASLKQNGLLIISTWNPECPYTSHLYFYDRRDHEFIASNSRTLDDAKVLLQDSGFNIEAILPICFLPDECYDAWVQEISEDSLLALDSSLGRVLSHRNSQMIVYVARKP